MSTHRKKNTGGRATLVDYFSELRRAFPDPPPGREIGAWLNDTTIQLTDESSTCRFEVGYVWDERDVVEGPLQQPAEMGLCRVVSIDRDKRTLTVRPERCCHEREPSFFGDHFD